MRRWFINLLCRWFHLIPLDIAAEIKDRAEERVRAQTIEDCAARIESIAEGLRGVLLGPIGQAQLEAYAWSVKVIRAPRFKSPSAIQSEAFQKIQEKARRLGA